MESNYYQVSLPFIGTFMIFSAQKCCQSLTFLFRGKVGYSTFSGISAIFSTILNGMEEREQQLQDLSQYLSFAGTSLIF